MSAVGKVDLPLWIDERNERREMVWVWVSHDKHTAKPRERRKPFWPIEPRRVRQREKEKERVKGDEIHVDR